MNKKALWLIVMAICTGGAAASPLAPNHGSIEDSLCLWLRMPEVSYDEATGTWMDLSGKGNDARPDVAGFVGPTLVDGENPTVFTRPFSAVHFDPGIDDLLKATNLNNGAGLTDLTVFYVIRLVNNGRADQRAVGFGSYNDGSTADHFNMSFDVTIRKDNGSVAGKNQDFPLGEFIIHAGRMDSQSIDMWFNSTGQLSQAFASEGSSYTTANDQFYVGDVRYATIGEFDIAEVVVFNTALTDEQIEGINEWLQRYVGVPTEPRAFGAEPDDDATDVLRDTPLSWSPVETAVERDVYFGTDFDDVNDAGRTDPRDVLVSRAQIATTFDPGRLEFGQTYYWRIDEVNGAPDHTVFKGEVWNFTTELLGYPVDNILATSNTTWLEGQGPERLVDGSGLDENDGHSDHVDDMWGGTPIPDEIPYVQFEFDRVYKLCEMLVWNYNMNFESILGYGIKGATIEYSQDALDWTVLGVVELAQGTSQPGYAANTTIPLDGMAAKYVRITASTTFSGETDTYGLSEVRFLYTPVYADSPDPADGTVDLDVDTLLSWRPGREAALHEVLLGTDPNALVMLGTTTQNAYSPSDLHLDETYFWRIDEVNDVETPRRWPSDLWNFSTQEYLVIEDFEAYNDDVDAATTVWQTWIDGTGDTDMGGSFVGNDPSPFAELATVHSGKQAMPLYFINTGGINHSEAKRTFAAAQNWTVHGTESLVLNIHGATDNLGGQLYVKINETKVYYDSVSDVLNRIQWILWPIDLTAGGVDLTSVTSLSIGVEGSEASGVLYVDDIRLYSRTAQMIEPTPPDDSDPNLMAYYPFEGTIDDSTGNYTGTPGSDPVYTNGYSGQAMLFNGVTDSVVCQLAQEELWPAYSLGLWARTDNLGQVVYSSVFNNNSSSNDFQVDTDGGDPGRYRYRGSVTDYFGPVAHEWAHLGLACDGTTTILYYNGLAVASDTVADARFGQIAVGTNRSGAYPFEGVIDEVRLYNRSLTTGEMAGLAGITEPIVGSF